MESNFRKWMTKENLRNAVVQYLGGGFYMQDVIAGLSVAGLLLPQALAYSGIGNVPAQAGIIALIAGLLCYAILGSSRFAIVSPTSSSAVVMAAATLSMCGDDQALRLILCSGLVVATGVIFIFAAITRMGSITDFIAKPVLRGFTFGLAIVIIIKQANSALNISVQEGNLFLFILKVIREFNHWNIPCLILTAISFVLIMFIEWLRKIKDGKFRNLPSGTIVIILGIIAAIMLDLPAYGIPCVGEINLGLSNPGVPLLEFNQWYSLFEVGVAVVFILYAESYGSIRSFAIKHNDKTSPNRDLLALGVCNIVSGIFQGMPVGAGYSATAANDAYGAISRMAGVYSMIITIIIIMTALPYIGWIPIPVLAAIVIATMATTLTLSNFKLYFKWRTGRLVITSAVLAVLLLGVLEGLVFAIVISLILLLRQNSRAEISILGRLKQSHDFVQLSEFEGAQKVPGILIMRPDQAMFFANTDRILAQVRINIAEEKDNCHSVILSLEQTTDIDATSMEALRDFFEYMRSLGIKLILARLKTPVHDAIQFALSEQFPEVSLSRLSVARAVRLAYLKANPQDAIQRSTQFKSI